MNSISHSEVESYLLCRRKQYYGYGRRLQKAGSASAMGMGSAGHSVLEAFYRTILAAGDTKELQLAAVPEAEAAAEDRYDELDKAGELFQRDDRANLKSLIFSFYLPNEPFVKEGYRITEVEKKFNLDLGDGDTLPFVVDLMAVSPMGELVVVDHKFQYDFTTAAITQIQPQIPKYIGALRALGYKVSHGYYNMLRTRKIVGTKSKAQPEGAGPTLDQAIQLMPVRPNPVRVVATFEEQVGVSNELKLIHSLSIEEQDKRAYRTANKMVCQGCDFFDLCSTELSGGNAALVERDFYVPREKRANFDLSVDLEDA